MVLKPKYMKCIPCRAESAQVGKGSDSGWPEGGSLDFAKRIEARYKSLGGAVFYKARVRKILVENGEAKGILLEDGTERFADYVISTADGHATLFDMLEGKYLDDQLQSLYSDSESYPIYSTVQVSLGVDCDLSNYPHTRYIKMPTEVDGGGTRNKYLGFRHFCFDKTLMPEGKTALITIQYADFDWWKKKAADKDSYQVEKERIAREILAVAEECYPELKNRIETIDVATPMTMFDTAMLGKGRGWHGQPHRRETFDMYPVIYRDLNVFTLLDNGRFFPEVYQVLC